MEVKPEDILAENLNKSLNIKEKPNNNTYYNENYLSHINESSTDKGNIYNAENQLMDLQYFSCVEASFLLNVNNRLSGLYLKEPSNSLIIILFPNVPLSIISNFLEEQGRILSFTYNFYNKGILFVTYFDLRSSIQCQQYIDSFLSNSLCKAFFSVPYKEEINGTLIDESTLLISHTLENLSVDAVKTACEPYGLIKKIEKTFIDSEGTIKKDSYDENDTEKNKNKITAFKVSYFDISDANHALIALSENIPSNFGSETTIKFNSFSKNLVKNFSKVHAAISKFPDLTLMNLPTTHPPMAPRLDQNAFIPPNYYMPDPMQAYPMHGYPMQGYPLPPPQYMLDYYSYPNNSIYKCPIHRRKENYNPDYYSKRRFFKADYIPLENNTVYIDKIKDGTDKRTTIMVRNIPNKYTQETLLNEINQHFSCKFDFFYLPIDFKNKGNVGYCFINFIEPETIIDFYNHYNNKKWQLMKSGKICKINYARLQGKEELIDRFKNSQLLEKSISYRPLIYFSHGDKRGQLIDFQKQDSSTEDEKKKQ